MKKLFPAALAILMATGCTGGFKTALYTDDQAMPLVEGRTDSLLFSISVEYPVSGAPQEVLDNITANILSASFDLEEDPGTVEETASRYEENIKDEYFTENEDVLLALGKGNTHSGILSWEDRVNGYFSGAWRKYRSYMIEYYNFRGGAHGSVTMTPIVFDAKTGEVVLEENFFADGYREPVGQLIRAHLPEALDGNQDDLNALFDPDQIGPNGNFEVTKDGITWYWQPYDIGPYYLGVISVSLPWKDVKKYLRK
ncbi:MAG: DUF3298 domain-containing protein [Bacteroidales bacterium]|nr:DUF3298 domain-containing protein [Bacteroidales bacterium]